MGTTLEQGKERRRHRMYVTRNTEYHFRDGCCVAVRDRKRGKWLIAHTALHRGLSGSVRFNGEGEPYPCLGEPRVGDALFFGADGSDLVTSVLTAIERPAKQLVTSYPC
jgi:hypothetical protein